VAISGTSVSTSSTIDVFAAQSQGSNASQNPVLLDQRKGSSAIAKLSPFGVVRFSLDDLQARAQALKDFSRPPNLGDFKVAVEGVVGSLNSLRQAAAAASSDNRARQTLGNVDQAIAGKDGAGASALLKSGVERQKDGSFAVNQQRLDKAFENDRANTLAAFSGLASRLEKVNDKPLSSSGISDQNRNNLSHRPSAVESDHNDAQRAVAQTASRQALAAQQASASSFAARNAVATYFSVGSF
jgi:hypothetical protein